MVVDGLSSKMVTTIALVSELHRRQQCGRAALVHEPHCGTVSASLAARAEVCMKSGPVAGFVASGKPLMMPQLDRVD